jgi:L-threonylcarbamoyladenylate synthase
LDEAVSLLRNGELVCYPTDTVYGLGAAAGNDDAVRRLFAVKGRPLNKPMPLLIGSSDAANWYAGVTPVARTLMTRFWPGALTIIMTKNGDYRSLALAGQDKIALRVPDHDFAREMIHTLGEPITGTSANRTGGRPPVSASEVAFALGEMVSLVIDGGRAAGGQESTVIDITVSPPQVVREGVISREELQEVLGKEVG